MFITKKKHEQIIEQWRELRWNENEEIVVGLANGHNHAAGLGVRISNNPELDGAPYLFKVYDSFTDSYFFLVKKEATKKKATPTKVKAKASVKPKKKATRK